MKTIYVIFLVLAACGSGVEEYHKPTTFANPGYRCFPEEVGDVQCYRSPDESVGTQLRCEQFNQHWDDYHVWKKTGSGCL